MSTVLVICAMEEEARYFRPHLSQPSELPLAGALRRTRGFVGTACVHLVVCGIGSVHATMATTAALQHVHPIAILNCGCSGAHVRELRVGDVVVATDVAPLDVGVIARDGAVRRPGVRRRMQDAPVRRWPADERLLAHARRVVDRASPGGSDPPKVAFGVVGSSDTWRQATASVERVRAEASTLCEEMEAAAVAQVADAFGVPFLAVKDIANNELVRELNQLEPEHTSDAQCAGVALGRAAAEVSVRLVRSLTEAGSDA